MTWPPESKVVHYYRLVEVLLWKHNGIELSVWNYSRRRDRLCQFCLSKLLFVSFVALISLYCLGIILVFYHSQSPSSSLTLFVIMFRSLIFSFFNHHTSIFECLNFFACSGTRKWNSKLWQVTCSRSMKFSIKALFIPPEFGSSSPSPRTRRVWSISFNDAFRAIPKAPRLRGSTKPRGSLAKMARPPF